MFKVKTLNEISQRGLDKLPESLYQISKDEQDPDGIILRSYPMTQKDISDSLLCVARAGAGVNNIPIDKCSEKGIVVFNTPGANANAVKELVVTGLLLSGRKIVDGINWTQTLKGQPDIEKTIEKNKSNFIGPELKGKMIGIIGLGAIGVMTANICKSLGMIVEGYDPYISVDAAWGLSRSIQKAYDLKGLLSECDYVTTHVPLSKHTKGMFNTELFESMKMGATLLNFSRGEIVDHAALKSALESGKVGCYVTDFPNADILAHPNVIAFPHLGASTPESEDNCAKMAARELKLYLETGSISNSVNYPSCLLGPKEKIRITVTHKNIPNIVSPITSILANHHINIDNMVNKSKGDWAYTAVDVDDLHGHLNVVDELRAITGVTGVRML